MFDCSVWYTCKGVFNSNSIETIDVLIVHAFKLQTSARMCCSYLSQPCTQEYSGESVFQTTQTLIEK